ncbi:hypothetical protein FC64_GL000391 [Ligilactobacillus araffinosus DSM 20653]|uniref:Glycosyltransferase RgtA/B/C/D-like domain-containing protein n=1 Tax=Ligilactobacillus araffinosus DSM 20653 TaxID=1423820 RepID=A0A0R1ZEV6_9LACO|nr:hypothetical protein FC64_GL000391 [Ligilactobacillus araffinosus DSM 20653]
MTIIIIIWGRKLLKNVDPRRGFLVFTGAFLIAGLFLVINMPTKLNEADQLFTLKAANQMNHGNFISLQLDKFHPSVLPFEKNLGGYLAIYPFQLGYVTYLRLLECFSTNIRFFYLLNVLIFLLINYLLYRIVKLVTKNNWLVMNWTLLLSFAFLPELFFVLFIYGNIPGLCACLAAVYFGLKLIMDDSHGRFTWLWCVLLFVLAYQLKSNYQIAVLALGIVFVLHAIKYRRYKLIAMPLITFALMLGSNKLVTAAYEAESGLHLSKGLPMITYVAMGLEPQNNQGRGAGWYDGYTINLYVANHFDSKKTIQAAKAKIKDELKSYSNNTREAGQFFKDKFVSTWADPTFESVWIAPYFARPRTAILNNIYYGNRFSLKHPRIVKWYQKSMKPISAWCNIVVVTILVLAAGLILYKKTKLNPYATFAILYLMGGMAFHLMWETKSQYVFQYIVCLIPVAAMLLGEFDDLDSEGSSKKEK